MNCPHCSSVKTSKLAEKTSLDQSRKGTKECLAQIMLFFNRATPELSFQSVKADILGGQLTIDAKADGETYGAVGDFVTKTSKGLNVANTVLGSAHSNIAFGPRGVSFELTTKVNITQ